MMREFILAAGMLCFMALPGSTQPLGPGTVGLGKFGTGAGAPWLNHAMRDVGSNPTGWSRQWCARSMNIWLQKSGRKGCGGNTAISCLQAGKRISKPKVGAIAVMKNHVGIVKAVNGNSVTLVSGNHAGKPGNRTVGVSNYSKGRIVGYVWPN